MALDGDRTLVGFGFGPIQTGLFVYEAVQSGNFRRIVIAEVARDIVEAVRADGGIFSINVAHADGVRSDALGPIEILDPADARDRETLVGALAAASEIATAVPSVRFYRSDGAGSIHRLIARGLERRTTPVLVYAAENHNEAAELLATAVLEEVAPETLEDVRTRVQFLNTVVSKMSGAVVDPQEIAERGVQPLSVGLTTAHLVEEFNHILVSRPRFPKGVTARHGITVFEEKDDLLPFEEAKLYGHNAAHALAAYLAMPLGLTKLSELSTRPEIVRFVRDAFLQESGAALIRKYAGRDALFTEEGYRAYVDDLLGRMLNPHLGDAVHRVARDPRRKLGWNDRLIGTMRLALERNIEPRRFAVGVAAALDCLQRDAPESLSEIWSDDHPEPETVERILHLVEGGRVELERLCRGNA